MANCNDRKKVNDCMGWDGVRDELQRATLGDGYVCSSDWSLVSWVSEVVKLPSLYRSSLFYFDHILINWEVFLN